MTSLIVFSALLVAGMIVMTVELRNAPEGREDEGGFHYIWRNFTPETRDVACVWAPLAGTQANPDRARMQAAA